MWHSWMCDCHSLQVWNQFEPLFGLWATNDMDHCNFFLVIHVLCQFSGWHAQSQPHTCCCDGGSTNHPEPFYTGLPWCGWPLSCWFHFEVHPQLTYMFYSSAPSTTYGWLLCWQLSWHFSFSFFSVVCLTFCGTITYHCLGFSAPSLFLEPPLWPIQQNQ